MSNEVEVLFTAVQKKKVNAILVSKNLLSNEDGGKIASPPLVQGRGADSGVFIEWKRCKLVLEYKSWDGTMGGEFAVAIAQRLISMFGARKAGWSSDGWCKSVDEFMGYTPFKSRLAINEELLIETKTYLASDEGQKWLAAEKTRLAGYRDKKVRERAKTMTGLESLEAEHLFMIEARELYIKTAAELLNV